MNATLILQKRLGRLSPNRSVSVIRREGRERNGRQCFAKRCMEDSCGRPVDLHSVGGANVALSFGHDRLYPAAGKTLHRPINPGYHNPRPQTLDPNQPLGNWTGAPRSPNPPRLAVGRTWAEKDGAKPHHSFLKSVS